MAQNSQAAEEYEITVKVTAESREGLIDVFEYLTRHMKETDYSQSIYGGSGGSIGGHASMEAQIKTPAEKPLSEQEIRKLRNLLKNKAE